jgi:hypothetical protein
MDSAWILRERDLVHQRQQCGQLLGCRAADARTIALDVGVNVRKADQRLEHFSTDRRNVFSLFVGFGRLAWLFHRRGRLYGCRWLLAEWLVVAHDPKKIDGNLKEQVKAARD